MEITNAFEVPLKPAEAWKTLMDIPRIVPCMPGAELTGQVGKDTYNGKVSVKLGPVALAFAGQVKFTEIGETAHKARAKAQGKDSKGRGGANATIDFHIEPAGAGSRVLVKTDLSLSGAVAQYGRASGLIQEVASQLVGQFANNLKAQLDAAEPAKKPDAEKTAVRLSPHHEQLHVPRPAKPISGLSLILKALWNSLRRLFGGK
jgi:uncharacterized protein